MQTFRDLLVWQKGIGLVQKVYLLTSSYPKDELYGLVSQMRRSSVSVPSNIAEGHGRRSTPDFIRFLRVASGSLYELETQLEISRKLGFIDDEKYKDTIIGINELERMLGGLINSIDGSN